MSGATQWVGTKPIVAGFRKWLREQIEEKTDVGLIAFAEKIVDDPYFQTLNWPTEVGNWLERDAKAEVTADEFRIFYSKYETVCKTGTVITKDDIATVSRMNVDDMKTSVLEGRLGEICEKRLRPQFPMAYAWPALLAAATDLIDISDVRNPSRTNLFVALVGPAGTGKSQAIEQSCYLLGVHAHELMSGSIEGLLARLGDCGGTALVSPDELLHLLGKAQITNASFATVLSSLFYKDERELTVAQRKVVKFHGRLSLVGGLVDETFGDGFGSSTTFGLYDRFIFGECPTGFNLLFRPINGPREFELDPDPMHSKKLRRPVISPDVWEARDEIVKKENIKARILELGIRAATICAAFDGREKLNAVDLEPAWAMARYQHLIRKRLVPNPGKNSEAQASHKILSYLETHAPDGKFLPRRDVLKASGAYPEFGPVVCDRVINHLIGCEELEQGAPDGARSGTRGPQKQYIRLAPKMEIVNAPGEPAGN